MGLSRCLPAALLIALFPAAPAVAEHTLDHIRVDMNNVQAQKGCKGRLSLLGVVSDMPQGVHSLPLNNPIRLAWNQAKASLQPLYQQREAARQPIEAAEQKWKLGGGFVVNVLEGAELQQYLAAEQQVAALQRQITPLELQAANYQEQARLSCGG